MNSLTRTHGSIQLASARREHCEVHLCSGGLQACVFDSNCQTCLHSGSVLPPHCGGRNSGYLPHFAFVLRALLTNDHNSCPPELVFSMFDATLERIRRTLSGTTLSWQCSHRTTNAITEVLLFCVCVCV